MRHPIGCDSEKNCRTVIQLTFISFLISLRARQPMPSLMILLQLDSVPHSVSSLTLISPAVYNFDRESTA